MSSYKELSIPPAREQAVSYLQNVTEKKLESQTIPASGESGIDPWHSCMQPLDHRATIYLQNNNIMATPSNIKLKNNLLLVSVMQSLTDFTP